MRNIEAIRKAHLKTKVRYKNKRKRQIWRSNKRKRGLSNMKEKSGKYSFEKLVKHFEANIVMYIIVDSILTIAIIYCIVYNIRLF